MRDERVSAGWNVDDTERLPLRGWINSGSMREPVVADCGAELVEVAALPVEGLPAAELLEDALLGFSIRTPEPEPQRPFKRWKNEPLLTIVPNAA
ncbi:MAG: hypothetical protein ACI9S9_004239 [Planctomycetota bacterium]